MYEEKESTERMLQNIQDCLFMKSLSLKSILSMFAKNCHKFVYILLSSTLHLSENTSTVVL